MDVLLDVSENLPRRALAVGDQLLAEGTRSDQLFVLLEGALQIEKGGQVIAAVRDRGACIGEMSLLLDIPATADVVASESSVVAVVEDAGRLLTDDPSVALALARVLATRVQRMTTYLADLQQQYADHEGGLGMVGTVLGSLLHGPSTRSELGSERDPDPEY